MHNRWRRHIRPRHIHDSVRVCRIEAAAATSSNADSASVAAVQVDKPEPIQDSPEADAADPDATALLQERSVGEVQTAPSPTGHRPCVGRKRFTAEEDEAMLEWVAKHDGKKDQGVKIWVAAEFNGLTKHSWQSMQSRWRTRIRPLQLANLRAQHDSFRVCRSEVAAATSSNADSAGVAAVQVDKPEPIQDCREADADATPLLQAFVPPVQEPGVVPPLLNNPKKRCPALRRARTERGKIDDHARQPSCGNSILSPAQVADVEERRDDDSWLRHHGHASFELEPEAASTRDAPGMPPSSPGTPPSTAAVTGSAPGSAPCLSPVPGTPPDVASARQIQEAGDVLKDMFKAIEEQMVKKEPTPDADGELRGEAAVEDDRGLDSSEAGSGFSSVAAALPPKAEVMKVEVGRSYEALEWEEERCIQRQVLEERPQEVSEAKRPALDAKAAVADVTAALAAALNAAVAPRKAAVPAALVAATDKGSEARTRPRWRCFCQFPKRQKWQPGLLELRHGRQSLNKMAKRPGIQLTPKAKLGSAPRKRLTGKRRAKVSGPCVFANAD